MKTAAMAAGLLALGLTIGPPLATALGALAPEAVNPLMLAGTVLWFATAPLWLRGASEPPETP
jgi:hypothetical protein